MPKASIEEVTNTPVSLSVHENVRRGALLSLLAIPVGIIFWVALWKFGFVASFVSFAIAWLAVHLYKFGAKVSVSRRTAPYVLGVIVVGVVLAFLSGMASDAVEFYAQETGLDQWSALLEADYWVFFFENVFANGELWSSYVLDLVIAVVFAILGCFGVVKDLFSSKGASTPSTKENV